MLFAAHCPAGSSTSRPENSKTSRDDERRDISTTSPPILHAESILRARLISASRPSAVARMPQRLAALLLYLMTSLEMKNMRRA